MGYSNIFGAEDDPIGFAWAEEQPRLYIAPDIINRELCRMLSARPAEAGTAPPMKRVRLSAEPPALPPRGYEWPIG
jgi:hypothetical protein